MFPNGTYATYDYDTRNRLTNLTNYAPGDVVIAGYTYTLDGVGNRIGADSTEPLSPSNSPLTINYTYNPGNILTSANDITYDHDDNGNLIQKVDGSVTTSYTYDPLDRLTEVDDGTNTYEYEYNGLGHRTAKIVNGERTNYLVDPNGILPQVLAETDEFGGLVAFYVYDRVGLVAKRDAAGHYYFYHFDGLGSTIAITDENANIVNSYAYSPYGLVTASQEQIPNPFKYVGRYGVMDEGNGLYFMRARYYDPEVGRFTAKDPVLFAGGDIYLYGYCLNNPIIYVDPAGLLAPALYAAYVGGTYLATVYGPHLFYRVAPFIRSGYASAYASAQQLYSFAQLLAYRFGPQAASAAHLLERHFYGPRGPSTVDTIKEWLKMMEEEVVEPLMEYWKTRNKATDCK